MVGADIVKFSLAHNGAVFFIHFLEVYMAKKRKNELPSGNVRLRVYDYTGHDGVKHYRSFTGPSKAAAQMMVKEWRENKQLCAVKNTVYDVVEDYLTINESRWSVTTYRTYKGYLRYFAEYPIGDIKLHELTNSHVQRFVNDLAIVVSGKTVRNVYQVLKPAVELKREDFRFRVVLPAAERSEKHLPTAEEVKRVFDACNVTELRIAILCALQGMMRRGEVCAVTFDDVDYTNKTITINKAYAQNIDNEFVLKRPKTSSSIRTVAVSDTLLDLIRSLGRKRGEVLRLTPTRLSRRFDKTVIRAKVTPFSFHALRHLGESTASAINMPAVYTEQIGGWQHGSEVRTRHYDHVIGEEQKKYNRMYLEKIDSYF